MQAEKDTISNYSSMKTLFLIVFICFASLITLLFLAGQKSALALDDDRLLVIQDAKVEVTPIQLQTSFMKPRTVYGRVEPLRQANIGFELTGLLSELLVMEGQHVVKGQALAKLDKARLGARKNELLSELDSAKANAKLAKLSAERSAELVANKLESQQRLDESVANLDASNALVAQVKARLASLDVELAKSTLLAPFDGQIITQLVDQGTVVNSGLGIFTILETSSLEARFGLPEQTASKLTQGQQLVIQVNGLNLPASVKSIANQRNFATRTIEAVLTIESNLSIETLQLVSGDLTSLSIEIPTYKTGAWIPLSSLASAVRGLWTVYVVNSEQRIEKRMVSIEFANDEFAYITGAITDGDKVVISGIHRLAPDQYVKNMQVISLQPRQYQSFGQTPRNSVTSTGHSAHVDYSQAAHMDDQ